MPTRCCLRSNPQSWHHGTINPLPLNQRVASRSSTRQDNATISLPNTFLNVSGDKKLFQASTTLLAKAHMVAPSLVVNTTHGSLDVHPDARVQHVCFLVTVVLAKPLLPLTHSKERKCTVQLHHWCRVSLNCPQTNKSFRHDGPRIVSATQSICSSFIGVWDYRSLLPCIPFWCTQTPRNHCRRKTSIKHKNTFTVEVKKANIALQHTNSTHSNIEQWRFRHTDKTLSSVYQDTMKRIIARLLLLVVFTFWIPSCCRIDALKII